MVPAYGPLNSSILFVGEAPGIQEVAAQRPFVGPAGLELQNCCTAVGIDWDSCRVTNVIKEKPPGNDITPFLDKKGFTPRAQPWLQSLQEEVLASPANVIVACGTTAMKALTNVEPVTKWRGSVVPCAFAPHKKVLITHHPSTVVRGEYLNRWMIAWDLSKALRESKNAEFNYPKHNFILYPSHTEAVKFLREAPLTVTIDIEVVAGKAYCLAVGYDEQTIMCIPVAHFNGLDEVQIWRAVQVLLGNPERTLIGQNILFDITFLQQRHHVQTRAKIEDTMVAFHRIYPELPKGLDFLTSIYTDQSYYKDEGKQWKKISDERLFFEYNCKDVYCTLMAWREIAPQLDNGYRKGYEIDMSQFAPFEFMSLHGLALDHEWIEAEKPKILGALQDKVKELRELTKDPLFNPASTKQIKEFLTANKIKIPTKRSKDGQVETTEEEALRKLAVKLTGTRLEPILYGILDYRTIAKYYETYLEMLLDDDGRLRGAMNPGGTVTGRPSSSQTIFGTGGNLQNLPPAFKKFILPD